MKRRLWTIVTAGLLVGYLLTGLFLVRGNEQVLLRRFGRAAPRLLGPGLYYALPWPASRIDRLNLSATRQMTVGLPAVEEGDLSQFERPEAVTRRGEFLTGDKNVLHLAAQVQYRIRDPHQYLLLPRDPERHLSAMVEQSVTDLVARSGVDFVHPLGLNELRQRLTALLQDLADRHRLGVTIEDVSLNDVRPPLLVKQAFLDVSNARAERDRLVSEAQTQAQNLIARAEAQAHQSRDRAEAERHARKTRGQADADRFRQVLASLNTPPAAAATLQQRRLGAMQFWYLSTLSEILPQSKSQILIDGQDPLDLSIIRPLVPPATGTP